MNQQPDDILSDHASRAAVLGIALLISGFGAVAALFANLNCTVEGRAKECNLWTTLTAITFAGAAVSAACCALKYCKDKTLTSNNLLTPLRNSIPARIGTNVLEQPSFAPEINDIEVSKKVFTSPKR